MRTYEQSSRTPTTVSKIVCGTARFQNIKNNENGQLYSIKYNFIELYLYNYIDTITIEKKKKKKTSVPKDKVSLPGTVIFLSGTVLSIED